MKLWTQIEIPNLEQIQNDLNIYISNEIMPTYSQYKSFIVVHPKELQIISPILIPTLHELDIELKWAALIVLTEHKQLIHRDAINSRALHTHRLNIPLLHCEKSTTRFYDVDETKKEVKYFTDSKTDNYMETWNDDGIIKTIDEYVLNKPTIIDITVAHQVITDILPNNEPRACLSVCPENMIQLTKHL
jgi:hypothetical protein